jgi:hypothetical protein
MDVKDDFLEQKGHFWHEISRLNLDKLTSTHFFCNTKKLKKAALKG